MCNTTVYEKYHLNFRYNANYGRSPEYSWRFDQNRAGSGSLGDIGSHFIYLSVWFFGAVTHVSAELCAFIERPDIDPSGHPYVRADCGSICVLEILTSHRYAGCQAAQRFNGGFFR